MYAKQALMVGSFTSWLVRVLRGGGVPRQFLQALVIGVIFYLIIYCLERASGARTSQYHSRGFLHDIAYWLYYRSGLNQLLFTAALFGLLGPKLAFVRLTVINHLPFVLRAVVWLVVADFTSYWIHRLQHASPFIWAFHSTHHSQEQLNFATTTRFHPVDHFISDSLKFVPLLVLGASPLGWLPLYLAMDFVAATQHSQITWRFGPLSKVFVTPRFHSFHHSTEPCHYNKNFGALLSIWDHLFGTAVDAPEQPRHYGLVDIRTPTFVSTLVLPFYVLRRTFAPAEKPGAVEVEMSVWGKR